MVGRRPLSRSSLAGDPAAKLAHVKSSHVCLNWCPLGGANHVASRVSGRAAKLGLPIHLGPGRILRAVGTPRARDSTQRPMTSWRFLRMPWRRIGQQVRQVLIGSSECSTPSTVRTHPQRWELGHLTGYAGSRPVRAGNAASDQEQFDILVPLSTASTSTQRRGMRYRSGHGGL